jgi:hypothetical protein
VKFVPAHVLNRSVVMQNLKNREDLLVFLLVLFNVPNADAPISEA